MEFKNLIYGFDDGNAHAHMFACSIENFCRRVLRAILS